MRRLAIIVLLLSPLAAKAEEQRKLENPELISLMRELADEAFEKFVVQDPDRRVYGMTYEFVQDSKQVQDFGLDSMHDGAWLMSALVTAQRVDPEGRYLQRAQKYQIPFYVNVLRHSDRLFPNMIPREGQERFEQPIKGWAPRGWDDGQGIDLVAGVPFSTGVVSHENGTVIERTDNGSFAQAYYTSSHHLLQDLADSLLNVWLTTRDPRIAEAIMLIHRGRMEHGHRVPVVQRAAGFTNGLPDLCFQPTKPFFEMETGLRPLFAGLVANADVAQGHYDDGLAWRYREETARAALEDRPIAPGFVATAISRLYCQRLVTEAYFTTEKYRDGYMLSPGAIKFSEGRLEKHHTDNVMMFSRGIQFAWLTEAMLLSFQRNPETWRGSVRGLGLKGTLAALEQRAKAEDIDFSFDDREMIETLDRYTLGVIKYWNGVRDKLGYLPRGYFIDGRSTSWVRTEEVGAYAHLIKLIAFRLMREQNVTEVELIRRQTPATPLPFDELPDSVLKLQGLR